MFWKKKRKPSAPEPVESTQAPPSAVPAPAEAAAPVQRQLSYRIGNLQGVGSRARQEDSFCFVNAMDVTAIREQGLFAVMADGMGGMADGKVASETVSASLRADFQSLDREADLSPQLQQAVCRASERVFEQLHGDGGSTLVACLFYQQKLWFVSVGDSALYLLRGGELLRLNREQNVLHEGYISAILRNSSDPTPARENPEKHALTQFLGIDGLSELDCLLRPLKLCDGDCFLLCSDGVSDVVPDEMIRTCLQQPDPTRICAALEEAVLNANNPYQDNYTALIVQCGY